jgi:hypothetical protein
MHCLSKSTRVCVLDCVTLYNDDNKFLLFVNHHAYAISYSNPNGLRHAISADGFLSA